MNIKFKTYIPNSAKKQQQQKKQNKQSKQTNIK